MAGLRRHISQPENKAAIAFALAVIAAAMLPRILGFGLGQPWSHVSEFSKNIYGLASRLVVLPIGDSLLLTVALTAVLDCSLAAVRRAPWKDRVLCVVALALVLFTWRFEIAFRNRVYGWVRGYMDIGDYRKAIVLAAVGAGLSGWLWSRRMKLSAVVSILYWCMLVFCMAAGIEWLCCLIRHEEA